jgi:cation diffusion facilitator family transporter
MWALHHPPADRFVTRARFRRGDVDYGVDVSPQRRTALVSVYAALALIALKAVTGLATGSLGLLSEAAHSGTDLVAALLKFFAVSVAVRPADLGHPYGHGKAEHLSALGEAVALVLVSLVIAVVAVGRLLGGGSHPSATWYAFVVVGIVIAIDASRAIVSFRAARRYASSAFAASALHFVSDLGGSTAVFVGLTLTRAGHPKADSAAAIFVAVLVLAAAGRLMRQNVDVLMDRVPTAAHDAARRAIEKLQPAVELRRLRMRRSAARHFADVVIGVPPAAALEQAHEAASAVEDAVEEAVPGTDVVVHVEPQAAEAALRERAHAAALRVPHVREIHNISVLQVGNRTEVTLHLKLPGSLSLDEAHAVASRVEDEIRSSVPEVDAVQTHLEPLAEPAAGTPVAAADTRAMAASVTGIVERATGSPPRELRFLRTELGLVAFLTLSMDGGAQLSAAHQRASEVEELIHRAHPQIADVIVHTEP